MKVSISTGGRIYSASEIERLPAFSPAYHRNIFVITGKYGKVVFDNIDGFGANVIGRNIFRYGLMAMIKVPDLLRLFPDIRSRDIQSYETLHQISAGYAIANPYLRIDASAYARGTRDFGRVVGHDGRARTLALDKLGVQEIPIQIQLEGCTIKDLEDDLPLHNEFINWLNAGLYPEGKSSPVKNVFTVLG
jgi:hypothetical protein